MYEFQYKTVYIHLIVLNLLPFLMDYSRDYSLNFVHQNSHRQIVLHGKLEDCNDLFRVMDDHTLLYSQGV